MQIGLAVIFMHGDIKQHLKQRYLNFDVHSPILDEQNQIATFLLYNLSGQIIGYQRYNPNGNKNIKGKYFTWRNRTTVALWGLETLTISKSPIFITEGIFDATRLTFHHQTAFATLANDPPRDYWNFLSLLNRPIVVVCDNDTAGRKLAKFGHYVEIPPDNKDLGEAPDDYVMYLIDKYRYF